MCFTLHVNVKRTINFFLSTSALEIISKLTDPDFARKAKSDDFFPRAWEVMRHAGAGDGDKVCDFHLLFHTRPELLLRRSSTSSFPF